MKFTLYNTGKEFSDNVLGILNRHEIQNNLIYKNIGDDKFMASVKDEQGNVILTAARTSPFPMTMYESDNIRNDDVVEFFVRSLAERGIDVDRVMTEKELARSFCELYGKITGKSYYCNESLVLYLLDKMNEISPIKGIFRQVNPDDMFYLPYWYADFPPACGIGEYNISAGVEGARKAVDNGNAYVWVDTYPVSVAASIRKTSDCAFIGQVYTPPNLRGRGYSTACVWNLSQKLFEDGNKYCALYADCTNPYSNRVYQKIGYKEIFWYDQYRFESVGKTDVQQSR